MKKLIYIFGLLIMVFSFNGCDYIYAPKNHYVSIYNNECDKYITSVYYRDNYSHGERWSKNVINTFVYPYDYIDLLLEEGTYDFEVIMEDDYYSYEVNLFSVYVYSNINLDICLDCYDKKSNVKVTRIQKENKKNNDGKNTAGTLHSMVSTPTD
jgi:hypothetical protein